MEKDDVLIKVIAASGDGTSIKSEFVMPANTPKVQLKALGNRMVYSTIDKWETKRKEHPNGEANSTQGSEE